MGILMLEKTLIIIKPDAFGNNKSGEIIKMFEDAGFRILAGWVGQVSLDFAKTHYAVHKEKPFFGSLTEFLQSGPVFALILEKENAVTDSRKMIGETDPQKSPEGTIRKLFCKNLDNNAIHGS